MQHKPASVIYEKQYNTKDISWATNNPCIKEGIHVYKVFKKKQIPLLKILIIYNNSDISSGDWFYLMKGPSEHHEGGDCH